MIAQVNDAMPWTTGDALVDVALIDVFVESDSMPSAPVGAIDEDSARIGALVAEHVVDGSTLQAGIGAVPTRRCTAGRAGAGRDLDRDVLRQALALERVGGAGLAHPHLGVVPLRPEGALTAGDNERVEMVRTETTNSARRGSPRNPKMVSVNTALQVDLFGQANAFAHQRPHPLRLRRLTDFIVGVLHSAGGQAFIALRSWHPKADCSTIVPLVDEPVTRSR